MNSGQVSGGTTRVVGGTDRVGNAVRVGGGTIRVVGGGTRVGESTRVGGTTYQSQRQVVGGSQGTVVRRVGQ